MIFCQVYDMNSLGCPSPEQEDGLQIYAVLNLHETPRKLLSRDKRNFYCHFALPLPKQVVVFAVGEWDGSLGSNSVTVEVSLDSEHPPKKIGTLCRDTRALCWESDWGKTFIEQSIELEEEDRMAKLVVSADMNIKLEEKESKKIKKSPFYGTLNCKKEVQKTPKTSARKNARANGVLTPQNRNTKLEDFWSNAGSEENSPQFVQGTPLAPPPLSESRRKRTPRSSKGTVPSGKRRKSLHSSEFTNDTASPVSSPGSTVLSSPKISSPPSTPCTPFSPSVKREGPSGRWGHAMCAIDDNQTVLIGGQGAKQQMVKDSLWVVSTNAGEVDWTQPISTAGTGADRRMGHSLCYDAESIVLYVYGGSKNKRWYSDVHKLNTKTWTWTAIQTVGKAPTRAYHSCNLFRGELWVFGGVYPNPDPQPDGCSNDMFVMSLEAKNWYTPIISSLKPLPRSGHSACLVDDRLVMFGGWDAPTCYNDLFFFDLTIMEYTQPTTTGTPPSPRSWHTAVTLSGKRMLIHGGYNGIKTLADAFIFDLGSLTWTGVKTPENLYPRAGHSSMLTHDEKEKQDKIAVFGGGDNLGEYFNDFTSFYPQAIDSS